MNTVSEDKKIILYQGIYKKRVSISDAVFMITGMTIGAGVLGVPYVVAQVGLKIGIAYIIGLGTVILCLNLILGEIAVRTSESLQITGLVGKYLGRGPKYFMNIVILFGSYGSLLAYIVGEGQALAALFGGDAVIWSGVFWSLASVIVWRGLQTIKHVEKVLSILVMSIILGLSVYILRDIHVLNWNHMDLSSIFLPYGVILFALNGTGGIIEAHALLPQDQKSFKKALIIGSLIPMVIYVIFAVAVVGAMGLQTTEIATIGLGAAFGKGVLILGNIFAILAMGSGFIGSGIVLKQNFIWDNNISRFKAEFFVISLPILLFLAGFRQFITILGTAGGVLIGIQAIMLILVCWQARKKGDIDDAPYGLRHFWLLAIPVLLTFILFTLKTIVSLIW